MQKRVLLTTVVFRTRIHLSGDLSVYEHFVGLVRAGGCGRCRRVPVIHQTRAGPDLWLKAVGLLTS